MVVHCTQARMQVGHQFDEVINCFRDKNGDFFNIMPSFCAKGSSIMAIMAIQTVIEAIYWST